MIDTTTKARIRREAEALELEWETNPRWHGVERTYTAEDVVRLRGSFRVEHSLARAGPSGCGRWCTKRTSWPPWERSPAARPWRWSRPDSGRSTSPAGR